MPLQKGRAVRVAAMVPLPAVSSRSRSHSRSHSPVRAVAVKRVVNKPRELTKAELLQQYHDLLHEHHLLMLDVASLQQKIKKYVRALDQCEQKKVDIRYQAKKQQLRGRKPAAASSSSSGYSDSSMNIRRKVKPLPTSVKARMAAEAQAKAKANAKPKRTWGMWWNDQLRDGEFSPASRRK